MKLRLACGTPLRRALIETLLATGWWLPDVCALDRTSVDLYAGTLVAGERCVRLTSEARGAIGLYLASRTDRDPALFVRDAKPARRLSRELALHHVRAVANTAGVAGDVVGGIRRLVASRLGSDGAVRDAFGLKGHDIARYRAER